MRPGGLGRPGLLLATLLMTAPVLAQVPAPKTGAAPPPAKEAPAAAPEHLDPAYLPDVLRLAELLGTLAYLRDLCGQNDGPEWRKRMTALLDAEGTTPSRKEQLAGAFNRGFQGYELTYRRCTDAAGVVIARSLDEGDRLSREITNRYGG